jgi:hypothetical protein
MDKALLEKNAQLHNEIEKVLKMRPELRAANEALALAQDLHVEVGAPFQERTQRKLQDRARAIIEHCPELASHFVELIPGCGEVVSPRGSDASGPSCL